MTLYFVVISGALAKVRMKLPLLPQVFKNRESMERLCTTYQFRYLVCNK